FPVSGSRDRIRLEGRSAKEDHREDRAQRARSPHHRAHHSPPTVSIGSRRWLPPIRSTGTSNLSTSVTSRSAMVGSLLYSMCCPPWSRPAPPPTSRTGRLTPEWMVLFEMPPPYRIVMLSSRLPVPSGVERSFSRYRANSEVW